MKLNRTLDESIIIYDLTISIEDQLKYQKEKGNRKEKNKQNDKRDEVTKNQ